MIFLFNGGFFTFLGVLFLVLLAIGGAAAEWVVRYSIGVWIVLLLCWALYAYRTIISLHERHENSKFSLTLGLLYAIPQIAVIATGYYYFVRLVDEEGAVSSVLDILACFGVYALATIAWNKLVVQDKVTRWAAILFSIIHMSISIFFILAFLFYQ